VRATLQRLVDIEVATQTFTAVYRMEASWIDGALTSCDIPDVERSKQLVGNLFVQGKEEAFFAPRLRINNAVEITSFEEWFQIYDDPRPGGSAIVCLRWNVTGVFQELFELEYFPMDIQQLALEVHSGWEAECEEPSPTEVQTELKAEEGRSDEILPIGEEMNQSEPSEPCWAQEDPKVRLVQNLNSRYQSHAVTQSFVKQGEYDLSEALIFTPENTPKESSASFKVYPTIRIVAHVHRQAGYYLWNVLLPLFVFTSILFCSFVVPPEDFADRTSVTLTMLLTKVAFKFIIADKLPKISYLTLIDKYILFCYGTAVVVIVENVLAALEVFTEVAEIKLSFVGAFVVLHLVFFPFVLIRTRRHILEQHAHLLNEKVLAWAGPVASASDAELKQRLWAAGLTTVVRVTIWDPPAAVAATKHANCHPSYVGGSRFAVVHFATEKDAAEAIESQKAKDALKLQIESLLPAWYCLGCLGRFRDLRTNVERGTLHRGKVSPCDRASK